MKVIYDPETDTPDIVLRDRTVAESDKLREGVLLIMIIMVGLSLLKYWMPFATSPTSQNHKALSMS